MRLRSLSLVAASLLLASCFNDQVPAGVQIACDSNADCPSGYLCRTTIGRCVPSDSLDQTPPTLDGTPAIAPAVARAGVTLTVDFKVSEALAADPVVRIEGRQLALDEAGTDRAALAYRYATEVAGNEPQGQPVPVTVDLVDVSGNSAAGLSAGNAFFDFTPPSLVTASEVSPAVAAAGAEVQVSFVLSEALGADPVVTMAAGEQAPRAWTLVGQGRLGRLHLSLRPGGRRGRGRLAGLGGRHRRGGQRLRGAGAGHGGPRLQGPAGRQRDRRSRAAAGAPGADCPGDGDPRRADARPRRSLAGADGDEGPGLRPGAAVRRGAGLPARGGGRARTAARRSDPLRGRRRGGQRAGAAAGGDAGDRRHRARARRLHAERREAQRQGHAGRGVLGQRGAARAAGGQVREPGDGARGRRARRPTASRCRWRAPGCWATYGVQVALTDLAGNAALLEPGIAQVDAVPPALIDAQFSPPVARLGITAYLTVTVSELLASPPVLAWDSPGGDPGFAFATRSGQAYIYSLPVTASVAAGVYRLASVALVDVAGNDATIATQDIGMAVDFTVDNTPPKITAAAGERDALQRPAGLQRALRLLPGLQGAGRAGRDRGAGRRARGELRRAAAAATAAPTRSLGDEPEGPTLIKVDRHRRRRQRRLRERERDLRLHGADAGVEPGLAGAGQAGRRAHLLGDGERGAVGARRR